MTDDTGQTNQNPAISRRRRTVRLALLILTVAVLTALAAGLQLSSR